MDFPTTDLDFLRTLVKTARQRPHHVRWIDRDGTARVTTLSAEDAKRVNELARQLGVAPDVLLRRAAELPALRNAEKSTPR
jgi:hypothetical protein